MRPEAAVSPCLCEKPPLEPTLDDLMAFNEELVAMIDAGIAFDVGLPTESKSAAVALDKINAVVARRVSQGATLEAALRDC